MSRKNAVIASTHLSNLYIFGSVVAILENVGVNPSASKSANKIIKICQDEMKRQLILHDEALGQIDK